MTVIRLVGNIITLSSVATVVPVANTYGANKISGATQCAIYNANTIAVANLWLNNSEGSFVFGVPPATTIYLQKVSTDTINTAAAGVTASPIARTPN